MIYLNSDIEKKYPISYNEKEEENKNNNLSVIIKPELINISELKNRQENSEFRPSKWEEFFGQESAKEKAKSFVEGCKKFHDPYPHTFISSPCGMGKSLFATILANQLNKKIVFTTGGELKSEQIFIDKLVEADGGVIFADEANRLPKRVGFFILPLIEQFEIQKKPIKKFSLFLATTHKGEISKDLDALIQRCDQINLEPYKDSELLQIVKQYKNKQYPSIQIPDNVYTEIVLSCRNTPRNAKNLVRAYAYIQDWNKIKQYNNIVKDGLNIIDIKVLQYLQKNGGAGKNSIANFLRIKPQTYEYEIEPYLMFKNLIKIENKREITEIGIQFLKEL